MATITFGKYSGKTTEELKCLDSDYLRWGAQNLRSDYWRREFAKALAAITENDEIAETKRWFPEMDEREIVASIEAQKADEEVAREALRMEEARQAECIAKWAEIMGVPVSTLARKVAEIGHMIYRADEFGPAGFSSRERYEQFVEFALEYTGGKP